MMVPMNSSVVDDDPAFSREQINLMIDQINHENRWATRWTKVKRIAKNLFWQIVVSAVVSFAVIRHIIPAWGL